MSDHRKHLPMDKHNKGIAHEDTRRGDEKALSRLATMQGKRTKMFARTPQEQKKKKK